MYRILFIDEQKDDIDSFKDYVEAMDVDSEFKVLDMYPLENEENMVDKILSLHIDAVVTDYMLNEYKEYIDYNVPYNGSQLVKSLLKEREGFPCFVMTAFDDEAVDESDDVNIVYIKGILHQSEKETKAKATFLDRIKKQIIHYNTRLENAENRLLELIQKKDKVGLDAFEEQEMVDLDNFIEKSLDGKSILPNVAKQKSESESMKELLNKVDELTKKIDQENE